MIRKGDVMMIMTHRSCQDDHVMIRKGELHLTESGWSKQCKDNDNENDNYIYTEKLNYTVSLNDQEGRAPSYGECLSARLPRRARVLGALRLAPRLY